MRLSTTLALLTAAALFPVTGVTAQGNFSVVGGLVSSKVAFSEGDAEGLASRTGFAAGLGIGPATRNGLSFNPEALYITKGIKEDGGDGEVKISYIEVPVLFRYGFGQGAAAKPFVTAGPSFAYQLSCKQKAEGDSQDCDSGEDGADIKSFDVGLMFGAGIQLNRLTVSGRYDLGLSNIEDNGGGDETGKVRNRAWLFLVGISF